LPPILNGIVREALRDQPDIELVTPVIVAGERSAREPADVLIVGSEELDDPGTAGRLLLGEGAARIVMITMRGDEAVLYQLRPEKTVLGELSPQGLVAAVRGDPADVS
jgi:hypothetical protein